jgi:D-arabinitol 4-dehydrogenase
MDGYSKIAGFIAPTVRERLAQNASIASVAMLPALFLAFLQRWHRGEIPYTYQDQAMDPAAAHAICESSDPVDAFCRDPILWGPLARDPRLVREVRAAEKRVAAFVQEHQR